MKKAKILLIISLIAISSIYIFIDRKKKYLSQDDILGVYVNDELSDKIPAKDEALFQKAVCDDENVKVTWDNDSLGLLISNLNKKVKCNLYFYSGPTVFDFDYTGDEQTFTVPFSGTYKLETWGAQGGSGQTTYIGGYGGYSIGKIFLRKNEVLFINIGGIGEEFNGGYNGGGYRDNNNYVWRGGAGGGATSIAKSSGILHELEEKINDIVLVSGGGGGACGDLNTAVYNGGAGGGFIGTSLNSIATPGSQDTSGIDANNRTTSSFGQGGLAGNEGGGGGGFYGGGSGRHDKIGYSGAGGSGYIGNLLLKDKVMYCYNCEESNEESTKTISTTCNEETPTSNCAKKGNGYARITLISIDE